MEHWGLCPVIAGRSFVDGGDSNSGYRNRVRDVSVSDRMSRVAPRDRRYTEDDEEWREGRGGRGGGGRGGDHAKATVRRRRRSGEGGDQSNSSCGEGIPTVTLLEEGRAITLPDSHNEEAYRQSLGNHSSLITLLESRRAQWWNPNHPSLHCDCRFGLFGDCLGFVLGSDFVDLDCGFGRFGRGFGFGRFVDARQSPDRENQ
ncbi:hypothetical protein Dimus_029928 [Dionaea muscipula]